MQRANEIVKNNNILGTTLKSLDAEKPFKLIPDSKIFNPYKAFNYNRPKKRRKPKEPNVLTSRLWDATATKSEQKKINKINNILGM